jgi:hypothetical protein
MTKIVTQRTGDRGAATAGTALVVVDEDGSNFLLSPPGRFPLTNLSAVLPSGQPRPGELRAHLCHPAGPSDLTQGIKE